MNKPFVAILSGILITLILFYEKIYDLIFNQDFLIKQGIFSSVIFSILLICFFLPILIYLFLRKIEKNDGSLVWISIFTAICIFQVYFTGMIPRILDTLFSVSSLFISYFFGILFYKMIIWLDFSTENYKLKGAFAGMIFSIIVYLSGVFSFLQCYDQSCFFIAILFSIPFGIPISFLLANTFHILSTDSFEMSLFSISGFFNLIFLGAIVGFIVSWIARKNS